MLMNVLSQMVDAQMIALILLVHTSVYVLKARRLSTTEKLAVSNNQLNQIFYKIF